ncbi:MAG: T9SS type A sorting domain-containing protein [Saprospiraceae bacterium]
MKVFLTTLFISSFFGISLGQHLYIYINNGDIYEVNPDYSLTLQTTIPNNGITDIAISPTGVMYGVAAAELIQIDLVTGLVTVIKNLPDTDRYVSLVCDQNFNLYTLSKLEVLYRYNILTDSLEVIAHLGDNTPGDLSFYKGNLIYQSAQDENIKAYNLQNGTVSTIQCHTPPWIEGVELWGLSNLFESCDTGRIFAFDNLDNLYEFDPALGTIDLRMHYDMFDILDVFGMASSTEYLASACSHVFEDIDCSTALKDVDATSASLRIYPNPAEDNVTIACNERINQVDVVDLSGRILKTYSAPPHQIDVSDLPGGIYLFHIYLDDQVVNKKIFIR